MKKRNVFICGAKSIGQYGGYETFLDKLVQQHRDKQDIQYYIITKANGDGCMDESKLKGVVNRKGNSFTYNNAKVFKLPVKEVGAAQAILYDINAIKFCIAYCQKYDIEKPIFYMLACRIGPFIGKYVKQIHDLDGVLYVNPDGHEFLRAKWSYPIRKYWKYSEQLMVKHSDLMICDSINIEQYIKTEYKKYAPATEYIAYGSDMTKSVLKDDDKEYTEWLGKNDLSSNNYYMCCGRFVPENSFEIMIREFMKSHSKKDFAIITTNNDKFLEDLDKKLHFKGDPRIKFVGTVYNAELLKKIRENAYANLHGHTVGGTNPSLLEALGSTKLNLLIDVGFNKEVAKDTALYWTGEDGNLAQLIDKSDMMSEEERDTMGRKAKERMQSAYSWEFIAEEYEKLWIE